MKLRRHSTHPRTNSLITMSDADAAGFELEGTVVASAEQAGDVAGVVLMKSLICKDLDDKYHDGGGGSYNNEQNERSSPNTTTVMVAVTPTTCGSYSSNDSLSYGTMRSPWVKSSGQSIISQRVRERSKFKRYSEPVPFDVRSLTPVSFKSTNINKRGPKMASSLYGITNKSREEIVAGLWAYRARQKKQKQENLGGNETTPRSTLVSNDVFKTPFSVINCNSLASAGGGGNAPRRLFMASSPSSPSRVRRGNLEENTCNIEMVEMDTNGRGFDGRKKL
jgi:hypothetical protein